MEESALAGLEPQPVWSLFEAISRVPRCSGKEQRIRAWVREWAGSQGIACSEDAAGNLLLRREAVPAGGRGGARVPTLVLQAHLDMVCLREPGAEVDPERDPLRLRREGSVVRADGTTLGADNGIGVALCLAALSDPRPLPGGSGGALEVLRTVDEECGCSGALGMTAGFFRGKRLLKLDSEERGLITIGAAGGEHTDYSLTAPRQAAPDAAHCILHLAVEGLAGGHSGIDIHRGRANAIKVLLPAVDCLRALRPALPVRLAGIEGGTVANAIAPAARLTLIVPRGDGARARRALQRWGQRAQTDLRRLEPEACVNLAAPSGREGGAAQAPPQAFSPEDSQRILGLLAAIPHGPLAYSRTEATLVETSCNLARASCGAAGVDIAVSCRSSVSEELAALSRRLRRLGEDWAAEPASAFLRLLQDCYEQASGAPVRLQAVHAGLECGVFKALDPALQIASIGPDIRRVHTPREEVEAGSVAVIWAVLLRLLQEMAGADGQEGR